MLKQGQRRELKPQAQRVSLVKTRRKHRFQRTRAYPGLKDRSVGEQTDRCPTRRRIPRRSPGRQLRRNRFLQNWCRFRFRQCLCRNLIRNRPLRSRYPTRNHLLQSRNQTRSRPLRSRNQTRSHLHQSPCQTRFRQILPRSRNRSPYQNLIQSHYLRSRCQCRFHLSPCQVRLLRAWWKQAPMWLWVQA